MSAPGIRFYYSTVLFSPSGNMGFTQSGSRDYAFGTYCSTSEITSNSGQNLFYNITSVENKNLVEYYKCFFLRNSDSGVTATGTNLWISNVASGVNISIGLDPTPSRYQNSSGEQAVTTSVQTDVPSGVTFSTPTSGSPLSVGDLSPLYVKGAWLKLTAVNDGPVTNDGCTVTVSYN